jgi:hypothetical protein
MRELASVDHDLLLSRPVIPMHEWLSPWPKVLQAHEMLWFSGTRKQMMATIDQLIHCLPISILRTVVYDMHGRSNFNAETMVTRIVFLSACYRLWTWFECDISLLQSTLLLESVNLGNSVISVLQPLVAFEGLGFDACSTVYTPLLTRGYYSSTIVCLACAMT